MQLDVIGCGDAYDSGRTNASILVSENRFNLLVDCGPTVPRALFARELSPEFIDAIYITHSHPDHCLGLTALLNWMASKGRRTAITIIAQKAQIEVLEPLVKFAHWPENTLAYPVKWVYSENCAEIGPWQVKTCDTMHAVSNRSLYLSNDKSSLFYSGDGLLTSEGEALAAQSDIAFVECELLTPHHSHGDWQSIQQLPKKPDSLWFLYHIDPSCRQALAEAVSPFTGIKLAEDNLSLNLAHA